MTGSVEISQQQYVDEAAPTLPMQDAPPVYQDVVTQVERRVDPDGIIYEVLHRSDIDAGIGRLCDQIHESGWKPDVVLSILRGGKLAGDGVVERLGIDQHYALGARVYRGIQAGDEVKGQTVEIYQPLPENVVLDRKKVLIIDEVNHTSTTLLGVLAHLKEVHGVETSNIRTGVLHEKPAHRQIYANFVVHFTDAWIVYPWEHAGSSLHQPWEFFAEKSPVWMIREEPQEQISWDQCKERFIEIGFDPAELPDLDRYNFRQRLVDSLVARQQEIRGNGTVAPTASDRLSGILSTIAQDHRISWPVDGRASTLADFSESLPQTQLP